MYLPGFSSSTIARSTLNPAHPICLSTAYPFSSRKLAIASSNGAWENSSFECVPDVRFSAYSKNSLSAFTPRGGLEVRAIFDALKFEKTTHFSLARVINTFNLLSPPS